MYSKEAIRGVISRFDIPPDGALLVYCADSVIDEVEGGCQTILDSLCSAVYDGLLVMPVHSWATINDMQNIFDPALEPSCSGRLGMELLRYPGALRSLNPEYSIAAYGKNAARLIENEHLRQTPFSREGCFGRLIDMDADILLIGCRMSDCSFIHAISEWNDIPERLSPPALRYIIMPDGSMQFGVMSALLPQEHEKEQFFVKLEQPLHELLALKEQRLDDLSCMMISCTELVRITSEFLICHPTLFSDASPVDRYIIDELRRLDEI